MRPWLHKSELAHYVESQRAMAINRNVSAHGASPHDAIVQAEDMRKFEHMSEALFTLKSRLPNHASLIGYIDELIVYLQKLQHDFPLPSPDAAFETLQPLKLWLFWLPPAVLNPSESDLGALILLAHFFAVALVLEPLFPDIGWAYLGNMSIGPLEQIRDVLQTRRNSAPHDTSAQIALSLIEFPSHVATTYRTQRQYAQLPHEAWRLPTHGSQGHLGPGSPLAMPGPSPTNAFGIPSAQSTHSMQSQRPSYFPAGFGSSASDMSLNMRPERSMSSGSSLSSHAFGPQEHHMHPPTSTYEYQGGTTDTPSNPQWNMPQMHQHRCSWTPSSVIPITDSAWFTPPRTFKKAGKVERNDRSYRCWRLPMVEE